MRLRERLQRHGGRLLLARYNDSKYHWHLEQRLIEARAQIPVVPLFEGMHHSLILPDDPHPNALAVRAAALWLAADLVARGWIEAGEGRPLPAVAAEAERQRALARSDEESLALSDAEHAATRAALHHAVDWRDATGLNQVYGAINGDGSAGARLLLALAPAGATLALELQALAGQPDLYPLEIQVEVDGRRLDPLVLPAGDSVQWRVELPPRPRADEPLELRLVPARWVVQQVDGTATLVSFRPLRIACEP